MSCNHMVYMLLCCHANQVYFSCISIARPVLCIYIYCVYSLISLLFCLSAIYDHKQSCCILVDCTSMARLTEGMSGSSHSNANLAQFLLLIMNLVHPHPSSDKIFMICIAGLCMCNIIRETIMLSLHRTAQVTLQLQSNNLYSETSESAGTIGCVLLAESTSSRELETFVQESRVTSERTMVRVSQTSARYHEYADEPLTATTDTLESSLSLIRL